MVRGYLEDTTGGNFAGLQWKDGGTHYNGVRIMRGSDGVYCNAGENPATLQIPQGIPSENLVGFSYQEILHKNPLRMRGIYQLGSARATVDNHGDVLDMVIMATNIQDLQGLYTLIRNGDIFPTESWEDPQVTQDLAAALAARRARLGLRTRRLRASTLR